MFLMFCDAKKATPMPRVSANTREAITSMIGGIAMVKKGSTLPETDTSASDADESISEGNTDIPVK